MFPPTKSKRKTDMTIVAHFDSTLGPVTVGLRPGAITLIAGPNGVGKSALLYQIYRSVGLGATSYLPGHRQINLNQSIETLQQDVLQLRQNSFNSYDAFNRYKGAWAEDQFKAILRTLVNLEHVYNRSFRKSVAVGGLKKAKSASLKDSPIDMLNVIFSHAALPVRFHLGSGGLTADRSGNSFAVEALSDGERASLFIVAAIITQDAGTALLIDEPEKHLHPSITGLLLETALRSRPDIAVVLSSHDMTLIERLIVNSTIYVKESQVVNTHPEQRIFNVELLTEGEIPEQLRVDVLGARSKILYVEGTHASRDAALYAHVYPAWKVISKGSSDKVIEATRGIRTAVGLHWISAVGLVDGDGRQSAEIEKLERQGILVLPTPTVENLFFIDEAQKCFVESDLQMRGGPDWIERRARFESAVRSVVAADRDNIIARRTVWRVQREIASQPLSVKDVRDGGLRRIRIDVAAIKKVVAAEVDQIIATSDAQGLISQLPIKNSDVPETAARALGAGSFSEYCQVIQRQIDIESDSGNAVTAAFRFSLPKLPAHSVQEVPTIVPTGPRQIGLPPPPPNPLTAPVLA